jgi:hypothetical protein
MRKKRGVVLRGRNLSTIVDRLQMTEKYLFLFPVETFIVKSGKKN